MLFLSLITSVFMASATGPRDHCEQFKDNREFHELIKALAQKLSYSYEELCYNTRIADIYHEQKLVYHKEDDSYHNYEFITLHYWEYSCQYKYDLNARTWRDQYCYNTL